MSAMGRVSVLAALLMPLPGCADADPVLARVDGEEHGCAP